MAFLEEVSLEVSSEGLKDLTYSQFSLSFLLVGPDGSFLSSLLQPPYLLFALCGGLIPMEP